MESQLEKRIERDSYIVIKSQEVVVIVIVAGREWWSYAWTEIKRNMQRIEKRREVVLYFMFFRMRCLQLLAALIVANNF